MFEIKIVNKGGGGRTVKKVKKNQRSIIYIYFL